MLDRLRQYAEVRRRLAELLDGLPPGYDRQVVGSALTNAGEELWIPPVKGKADSDGL